MKNFSWTLLGLSIFAFQVQAIPPDPYSPKCMELLHDTTVCQHYMKYSNAVCYDFEHADSVTANHRAYPSDCYNLIYFTGEGEAVLDMLWHPETAQTLIDVIKAKVKDKPEIVQNIRSCLHKVYAVETLLDAQCDKSTDAIKKVLGALNTMSPKAPSVVSADGAER